MPTIKLPFRVRQSGLETAKCLYHFQQNVVLGIKDPDSEFSERGTDFHELGRLYVNYLRAGGQPSDIEYADELLEKASWNLEAQSIFRNWVRSQSFDTATLFATEYRIRLDSEFRPVDEEDDDAEERIMYSADMDRLDISGTSATIRDYKTFFGTVLPTTIQAIFYPWILFKVMPYLEEITFELEFVRWGIVSEPRVFTKADLPMMDRYVEQQVARLAAAYAANEWPAAVNTKCVYCHLKCPIVETGLTSEAIGQIQTPERAAEMAGQLYALHQAAARIHANLKHWSMRNGPVEAGNDIVLGFSKVNKFSHQPKKVMELNERHGFEATRALSVDNAELSKIGKKYPEFVAEARESGVDRSTTAFKFWNNVGDPLEKLEEE